MDVDMRHMRLNRRTITWICLTTGLASQIAAASSPLQEKCRAMIQSRNLQKTKTSLFVVDLTRDEVLVRINPDQRMIPASNMKLITTAAALELLGQTFTFRTELRLIAGHDPPPPQDEGTPTPPDNTLLIVGDGDPALGDPKLLRANHQINIDQMLQQWVDAVRDAGVREVAHLTVDDRIFDHQWVHPDWPTDQHNRWYCAQVAGLNLHENCLYLYPEPTVPGHSPRVSQKPFVPFLEQQTRNRAITGPRDTFWVSRRANTNQLTYLGKVRHRRLRPVKVTVHDPPRFAAELLAYRLRSTGIKVASVTVAKPEQRFANGRTLIRWVTPLTDVVQRCNKDSQNLFAEALFKRMGQHVTGAPGSWANGGAAVRLFMDNKLGPESSITHVSDGCGLSRRNRVTARVVVTLLQRMYTDSELGPIFLRSLAVGGVDGTLRRRFGQHIIGTVHGKSGFINGVCTLSGYLVVGGSGGFPPIFASAAKEVTSHRVIAFSLLFNDIAPPVHVHSIKRFQNDLIQLIDHHLAAQAVPSALGG